MATTINYQELMFLLEHTPAEQNIMLAGRHGIGKSEILTNFYAEKGFPVVALFLGQMSDPGDLIGLPDKTGERTTFLPPYWFPTNGKPIVLFLDEINRSRPEILQCVMDLALNKRLAGRDLPHGSRIIAAVNAGEDYQVEELDPALVSRFNIYQFRPSVKDWLRWAEKNNLDYRVINFIKKNPDCLESETVSEDNLTKTPDRRAWKRVSDIIKPIQRLDNLCFKLISGVIGPETTTLFMKEQATKIDVTDFLKHFDQRKSILSSYEMHDFAALNDEIFNCFEVAKGNEVPSYIKGLNDYINYLDTHNLREAFAHFAYSFNQASTAKVVIRQYLPLVVKKLNNYQSLI